MEEFMFLGLRRMEGINTDLFYKFFGETTENIYGEQIEKLKKEGLLAEELTKESRYLKLTKRGIDLSNYVFEKFLF